jgi:hypothetical protein
METVFSSETLSAYKSIRRHNPEHRRLDLCDNARSYKMQLVCFIHKKCPVCRPSLRSCLFGARLRFVRRGKIRTFIVQLLEGVTRWPAARS